MNTIHLKAILALSLLSLVLIWHAAESTEEPPQLRFKALLKSHSTVPVTHLAFNPNGKQMFSIMDKGYLWDVAPEKMIATLAHPPVRRKLPDRDDFTGGGVGAAAFSPDGKAIATISDDGTICLWDSVKGKKLRSFEGDETASTLVFSNDGKQLSARVERGVRVWDVEKGKESRVRPMRFSGNPKLVSGSKNPPMLASGRFLMDAMTGNLCYSCDGGEEKSVYLCHAITRDKAKAATAGIGPIQLWDLTSNVQDRSAADRVAVFKHPDVVVQCIAFSPDGSLLAAGYRDRDRRRVRVGGILIFEIPSGNLLTNHQTGVASVYSLDFCPDGTLLATGDHDAVVKLWTVPAAWRKKK